MARLGDLISYLTIFIIVGIMAIIGLYILSAVQGSVATSTLVSPGTTGAGGNGCLGANASGCYLGQQLNNSYTNSTYGIAQVLSWLPIIGIVIAAAVVLGLLLHDLFGTGGKSE